MDTTTTPRSMLEVVDLGRMAYAPAYELQCRHAEAVIAARDAGAPDPGRLLLVEHDPPVVTVSRRPGARAHLLASPAMLDRAGVHVVETDRGGDITYHGPGQLVAYPIVDLNHAKLNLHGYMRLLESAVIEVCAGFGVPAHRDVCATGVWVGGDRSAAPSATAPRAGAEQGVCESAGAGGAKICALGVRVRRWVTMHGLALNVTTNLDHFGLIVPCGLAGRAVTSLERELGARCPTMADVKRALAASLARALEASRRARPDAAASRG